MSSMECEAAMSGCRLPGCIHARRIAGCWVVRAGPLKHVYRYVLPAGECSRQQASKIQARVGKFNDTLCLVRSFFPSIRAQSTADLRPEVL
jgi:hypothetical protein